MHYKYYKNIKSNSVRLGFSNINSTSTQIEFKLKNLNPNIKNNCPSLLKYWIEFESSTNPLKDNVGRHHGLNKLRKWTYDEMLNETLISYWITCFLKNLNYLDFKYNETTKILEMHRILF